MTANDLYLKHQPHGFEIGMKLEAVDRRNPVLIRVVTIADIRPSQLLIHFDGWSDTYDYWVDDDCPDIHPPGWSYRTGHPLTPPLCKLYENAYVGVRALVR